ncbi:MAG: hypothetical protein JKY89_05365 [Immundisolibacteraceae bacterium]|nr:hypothetical protein [Immundisolibacteraceae bacterium]
MGVMRTVSYEDNLMKDLQDPMLAVHYLNACLEEEFNESKDKKDFFFGALAQVLKANGVSKDYILNRNDIYESIMKSKNTRLDGLFKILEDLNLKLRFELVN